jgi:hypothetical protein
MSENYAQILAINLPFHTLLQSTITYSKVTNTSILLFLLLSIFSSTMWNRRIENLFHTCMVIAQLNLLDNALESESKWSNDLIHMAKLIDEDEYWWDYPIDRMNIAQRRSLKMVLLELQKLIAQRLDRLEGLSTQTQP